MVKSPSRLLTLLPCPVCGRSLIPDPTGASLNFRCKRGHAVVLDDLLAAQSRTLMKGLEELLAGWKCQHDKLRDSVEDARLNGYPRVAEAFERQADDLLCRIELLRAAFTVTESSTVSGFAEAR